MSAEMTHRLGFDLPVAACRRHHVAITVILTSHLRLCHQPRVVVIVMVTTIVVIVTIDIVVIVIVISVIIVIQPINQSFNHDPS